MKIEKNVDSAIESNFKAMLVANHLDKTLDALARQRARWQKELLDVLWRNRDMLFKPRYGRFG